MFDHDMNQKDFEWASDKLKGHSGRDMDKIAKVLFDKQMEILHRATNFQKVLITIFVHTR